MGSQRERETWEESNSVLFMPVMYAYIEGYCALGKEVGEEGFEMRRREVPAILAPTGDN